MAQAASVDASEAPWIDRLSKADAPSVTASGPAGITGLIGQLRQVDQKEQSDPDIQRVKSRIRADEKTVDDKYAGVKPMDVPEWNADQERAKYSTDPLVAFGSAGSLFAILASAFTKTPMVNALNGAAAAMNAIKAGDEKAYGQAYDAWKENYKLAMDRHKVQQEAFQNAMSKLETDPGLMKVYAAQYGDEKAAILSEAGLYQHLDQMNLERQRLALEMQRVQPELAEKRLGVEAYFDLQGARKSGDPAKMKEAEDKIRDLQSVGIIKAPVGMPRTPFAVAYAAEQQRRAEAGEPPMTADDIARLQSAMSGGSALTDDAAKRIAEQALAGDRSALAGLGYGNAGAANRAKVQDAISKLAKERGINGADIAAKNAEFFGLAAGERAVGTRTAGMDIAANEVKTMAPLAIAASKKVSRTQYPALNSILLSAEKGTGDENVVQFGLAANSLIYTYSKFLNPTGIPTDADKARATEILSTAWSSGQFQAAIDQIKKEISSGQSALKNTKQELSNTVTGKGGLPAVGQVEDGYRYKGGDPKNQDSWEKVSP